MNVTCSAIPCPVILDCSCVHYSGANLIYTGINTNDTLCVALEKIDGKFQDAGLGYIFTNGITQASPGNPVKLGGALIEPTTISNIGYPLTVTANLIAGAHVTIGGTSSQFVKGDGSLDNGPYQPAGNYIRGLTGDGTATGPGIVPFTLATVNGNPGMYGSPTRVPIITVNAKGLITSITQLPIAGGGGGVTSVSVTAGTGISASVANPTTTPNITITNTAPDQTVVLNNGAGINVTGTYPNFTIAATGTTGTLVALPFTTDHLTATSNPYVIGDVVYYIGNVYRCIANNDSILPTNALYWTNLGAGFPLVQQPSDWNSTSGNNQILNKPTIPTGTVTSIATTAPITGGIITTTGTIGITQAGAASDGYLSSGDWTTFNNKVGGSGTTNFVPKFSNTGTPATIADSQIFDNGTSVGIGTITPSASFKLDVVGNVRASAFGYFGNNDVRINTSSSGYVDFYDSTERKFLVGNGATDVASFRTYNGNIFQFDNNADFIPIQLARFSSQVIKSVGTDTHNVIQSSPIINATGGTTLVRGFYYDPNLTSTTGVTNVAFENVNGDIIHGNLATGGADEMVTVDTNGKLKKQAIPTGSSVGFEMNFLLMGA
jgi:hypothetical protein